MGLGDADLLDDGDGGGGGGKASAAAVPCSICLDVVTDAGDRSWAKLQCGHQFHLDCIGSAFNIKGAMQCPNCRKIEKGQWLYANGGRQLPEFSMDDLAHDEDLYDLSYSEMSFGVHWCPFSGLTRLPSSFDEGEFPSSAYHDLLGHHAIFAEHTPVSSTSHPCPYIAYFGPIHPSSSTSSGNVSDGSSFSNHWSGLSAPSEVPNLLLLRCCNVLGNYMKFYNAIKWAYPDINALQQQQWYEKEAALAEIEYSQKKLLKELKVYKRKDLEVIHEAVAFASETEDNNDLLLRR